METSLPVAERPRRPPWMKVRAPSPDGKYYDVRKLLHGASLVTVCEEARCPNIGECWGRGTATFQILGDTCTRACRYCYVTSGKPEHAPDPLEPLRLAQAAATMGLSHVVVTSVDDREAEIARPSHAETPDVERRDDVLVHTRRRRQGRAVAIIGSRHHVEQAGSIGDRRGQRAGGRRL